MILKEMYVYRITNIINNKHYYGVRTSQSRKYHYAKDDLGNEYFSSSKSLKRDIETLGKDNFKFKVVRIFDNCDDAYKFEVLLHEKFNVGKNPKFYNQATQALNGSKIYASNSEIRAKIHESLLKEDENGLTGYSKWNKASSNKMKQIAPDGKTFGYHRSRLAAKTCRETVEENGKTILENKEEKHRKTILTADENGISIAKRVGQQSLKTRKTKILNNGLTVEQQMIKNRKKTIEKNPKTHGGKVREIYIFNNNFELVEICIGNFGNICKKNNFPYGAFQNSLLKRKKLKYVNWAKWDKKFDNWQIVDENLFSILRNDKI